jgi:hypothetical protein
MVEGLALKVVDRLAEEEERTHNRGAKAPGTQAF